MKTRTMHFPGDPPMRVTEMTRAEFLHLVRADEVLCDFCGRDPGAAMVMLATERGRILRGYCLECALYHWFPFCTEGPCA